jgi:hypothetical protein
MALGHWPKFIADKLSAGENQRFSMRASALKFGILKLAD